LIRDAVPSRLALALLIATAALTSGCNQSSTTSAARTEAREHSERSDNYRQQGQFRAAIIEANNAIRLNPADSGNTVKLANLFNDLGQGKQAAQLLEPMAATGDKAVALALAEAYLQQTKFKSAQDYLATAAARLHLNDDNEVRMKLARAQVGLGDYAGAQQTLQALADSPQFGAQARIELAKSAFRQNDPETGNAQLQQVLQNNPNNVGALLLSAMEAEREDNLEHAEDQLSHALMNLPRTDILEPEKVTVLQKLVTILTKRGRSAEALIYSKALSDANPTGALLQDKFKQGVELFQAGKLDEAEPLLTEVYEQSRNEQVGTLLGMIKYAKNDMAGANTLLGANVDPEVASDSALIALASAQLRGNQPGKLLELIGPQDRAQLKNPQLKALVGIALIQQGDNTAGEALIAEAQVEAPDNKAIKAALARHYLVSRQPQKVIALLQGSPADDASLQQLLINAYFNAQKPEQALACAQKLAATQPAQSLNYSIYGHTALQAGSYDAALSALRKAIELQPKNTPARMDMAQVYIAQKQPQQAQAIYRQLVAANAGNISALKGYITCEEMAGDHDAGAIEAKLLKLSDTDTSRVVLAEFYLRNNRLADTERLLSSLTANNDPYPNYVRQLLASAAATSALQANDFEKARLAAIDGLRSDPRNPRLQAVLANVEIRTGNTKEAEKIIAQLEQNKANEAMVIELKGDMAAAARQWDTASSRYREIWRINPNDATAHKLYRSLSSGNAEAGNRFLDEWRQDLPNSGWPYFFQGVALQGKGDTAGAIKAYEAAVARNDKNAMAQNNLAWTYHETHDRRALATAQKAFALEPKNPVILDTLGWLLVENKQAAEGVAHLEEAAKLAPSSKEIADHLTQARAARL